MNKKKPVIEADQEWKQIQVNFGRNVFKMRKKRGLTQAVLAKACGIHITYVSSLENGERNVSLINIHKLAEALKCSPSKLFKEEE